MKNISLSLSMPKIRLTGISCTGPLFKLGGEIQRTHIKDLWEEIEGVTGTNDARHTRIVDMATRE
jgi:hypothetical protein